MPRSLAALAPPLRPLTHASAACRLPPASSADFDTVRQIKEKLCYMAFDYEQVGGRAGLFLWIPFDARQEAGGRREGGGE